MASLRTDSPISHSIVASFLQFLSSVEAAPGTDAEGLEVAAQCLSEVFGLSNSHRDPEVRLLPLVDLFTASSDSSGGWRTPEPITPGSDTPPTVSAAINASQPFNIHALSPPEVSAGEPSVSDATPGEPLLEQFREGLEWAGYFDAAVKGTPEYSEKLDRAKQTLNDALKKVKSQPAKQGPNAASESTFALAEAFKIQGNATMTAQRYHDAIQLYTLAISLSSNNAIFYANRAAALTQVEKYDEAIADCEVAIKLDPRYSKAYSRMGLVYFAQNRLQEAIEAFKKALEIDPSSTSVQENLQKAQQKFDERLRSGQEQQARSQPGENGATFTAASGSTSIPDMANFIQQNIPEISQFIPGIMSMAAEAEERFRQEAPEGGQNARSAGGGAPNAETDTNGGGASMHSDGVHVDGNMDGNFNVTFDGHQLPPQYTGLLQSVFQQMGWSQGPSGGAPAGSTPPSSGNEAGIPPGASPSPGSQSGQAGQK